VPQLTTTDVINSFQVLPLPVLAEFQLGRWRLDDQVDLRDMIDVGLLDATWVNRFPMELTARLQHLLDTPD
jgi:hypothetical protein